MTWVLRGSGQLAVSGVCGLGTPSSVLPLGEGGGVTAEEVWELSALQPAVPGTAQPQPAAPEVSGPGWL